VSKDDRFGLSRQDYYEILDATLTELLEKGGVEITDEIDEVLCRFNRFLKAALELTN
jgi:hypothetical protein